MMSMDLGKIYDVAFHTGQYDIDYIKNGEKCVKITPKSYREERANGTNRLISQDCVRGLKEIESISLLSQMVSNVLTSDSFSTITTQLRSFYKKKMEFTHHLLSKSSFCEPSFYMPKGGFSFLLELKSDVDFTKFIERVNTENRTYISNIRKNSRGFDRHFRFAFSFLNETKIECGIEKMERIYRELRRNV